MLDMIDGSSAGRTYRDEEDVDYVVNFEAYEDLTMRDESI